MSEIPGLKHDVFFGDDQSLPNWRESMPDISDPEAADADEPNPGVDSVLGYSAEDLFDGDGDGDKEPPSDLPAT